MCVILAVGKQAKDVTKDEFVAANTTNSDGFGAAWIDKDTGLVKFLKVTDKEVDKYVDWRPPRPYIFHFRIATVGESVPELCHPFIVSKKSELKVSGNARQVLFHNGHWHDWNTWLGITFSGIGKLPSGAYSDSRTMALLLAHYGKDALTISGAVRGQRIATLDKTGRLEVIGDFTKGEDGIYRSNHNHLWVSKSYYTSGVNRDDRVPSSSTMFDKCPQCQGWTSEILSEDGKCLDCKYPDGIIPAKDAASICQYCYDPVTSLKTLCDTCQELTGPIMCSGSNCDHELHIESSLIAGKCQLCRDKLDKGDVEKLRMTNDVRWYELVKKLVTKIQGKYAVIAPYSFERKTNAEGFPEISLTWLDKKTNEIVTGKYTFRESSPFVKTPRYTVTYLRVKNESK